LSQVCSTILILQKYVALTFYFFFKKIRDEHSVLLDKKGDGDNGEAIENVT
jgi:hypothetical protein